MIPSRAPGGGTGCGFCYALVFGLFFAIFLSFPFGIIKLKTCNFFIL